jgi:predicted RNA-binding Zn ribbon-like protein
MDLTGYENFMLGTENPRRFELHGGHPALDFVNSLDNRFGAKGPTELLTDYADLLGFMEQTGLLGTQHVRLLARAASPGAAARALQSARELREATASALYGRLGGEPVSPRDIRALERHFISACEHRELRSARSASGSGAAALAWAWGRFATEPRLPVWMLSQAASELMTSEEVQRVRACGVETCRWLFLDTSKNHTRRWCDMRVCGNRVKARRFQARRRA